MHQQFTPKDIERFWSKVDRQSGNSSCWEWHGSRTPRGYGRIKMQRQVLLAHRVAFEIAKGTPSDCVLHQCDNPACCNPEHLFEGSRVDNVRDMDAKGRRIPGFAVGQDSGRAKLREEDVRMLIATRPKGEDLTRAAASLGVSKKTIWRILSGESWAHLHS